ncbi:N-acetylglucosaminyl-diphospho-decaprenol L-rhamnosyltransferase [Clavibacter sp. B3I6]|uniref:glycosyltransferase family 2 protein n=1 Tax=Clavibacter sp. B3I6 TaxID=3042268 RepID=UPI002782BCED|nr:glycosyltransferase family 2 protein [Clavibacter sp. B3I6]MDQ0745384.1 N-acetylglucosaminyl-diphospho-decaprenol L-rhamnosyltransferase [Clavibacter sp. B3I6]
MNEESVSAVVVVFDTDPALLESCLGSLRRARSASARPLEVIVVDNSPHDRLAQQFGAEVDSWVSGHGNIGFGRAANLGIGMARHDNILLLNPDAELEPLALDALVDEGAAHPDSLLCGWLGRGDRVQVDAYMHWWSSSGRLLRRRGYRRYLEAAKRNSSSVRVQKVSGGGLYARRELLLSLGPFDERFFLYGEDADLSVRARQLGHALRAVPGAPITHHAASSQDHHSALIERARTDAAIRVSRYHLPLGSSLLTQLDLALVTVVGILVAQVGSSGTLASRRQRLGVLLKWGFKRDLKPFEP